MMGRTESFLIALTIAISATLCLSFHPKLQIPASSPINVKRSSRWHKKTSSPLFNSAMLRRGSVSVFAGSSDAATASKVSIVNVCTAELCNCQEDGFSGDEILKNLLARNLPYPVEEAPCLGACGGGAMVAIDFEDGSAALVSGIDETLMELRLERDDATTKPDPSTIGMPVSSDAMQSSATPVEGSSSVSFENSASTSAASAVSAPSEAKSNVDQGTATLESTKASSVPPATTKLVASTPKKPSDDYQDARARMRAQAASEAEKASNPWWTAATYLAQKAKESIMDRKD